MTSLTLQHAQKIRLARDDLERMVNHLPDQVFDDVIKGCTVKVLLEEENQARVYRIAWIAGVEQATTPYKFGATITTSKTLVLDFSIFRMAYQMNTISNSEFTEEEFRQWIATCESAVPFDVPAAELKAAELARAFEDYPEASTRGGARTRRPAAPQQAPRLNPQPPATARRPDGHLSSQCNEYLDSFTRSRRLSTDQSELVKAFAAHIEEYIMKERQRSLHLRNAHEVARRGEAEMSHMTQIGGAAGARGGRGSFATGRGSPTEKQENGSVHVAGNLDVMSVEELKSVISRLEAVRVQVAEKIDEKTKCIICVEHDARVVLLPCRHQQLCHDCAVKCSTCPTCRAEISQRVVPFVG